MHNHRLVDLARRTVRNSLTAEQRDEIKKAANDGQSASMIRLKQGLIKKQKEHEISDLVKGHLIRPKLDKSHLLL